MNKGVITSIDQIFGHQWILQSFIIGCENIQIIDNTNISIQVDKEELSGHIECNTYTLNHEISEVYQRGGYGIGGTISFGNSISTTLLECLLSRIMEHEIQLQGALIQTTGFETTATSLELFNEEKGIFLLFEINEIEM